jgi:hypothetical protein
MRTLIDTAARGLLTGALLVFTSQCGAQASSPVEPGDDGAVEATQTQATPVALFRAPSTSSGPAGDPRPSGLAFDSSRYVPQAYDGAPSGTGTYGVFLADTTGIMEWFATPSGSHAAAATGGPAIGSLGIEYSATFAKSDGNDSIVAVSQATAGSAIAGTGSGGATSYVEQVYQVSFPSDVLGPSEVKTLGGPLPLPLGSAVWPSVVGVSNGYARLVIAGEGQCCPGGSGCGGAGEPSYENFIYEYAPDGTASKGPSFSGVDGWSYVVDASGEHPACAVGLGVDNANSAGNVPGEVTFILYADGSVQPWLTNTTVWGPRSSWKVAGAVSVAAYNQHVAILDGEGNVYSANPYSPAAPKLVYASGASQECGGKVLAMAFDVTDVAASESDPGASGGSLILEMQDATAGDSTVVCSIAGPLL